MRRELASVLKPTGEESFLLLKGRERWCSPIFNPFILNMKRLRVREGLGCLRPTSASPGSRKVSGKFVPGSHPEKNNSIWFGFILYASERQGPWRNSAGPPVVDSPFWLCNQQQIQALNHGILWLSPWKSRSVLRIWGNCDTPELDSIP